MVDSIDLGSGPRREEGVSTRRLLRLAVGFLALYLVFSIGDVAWMSTRRTDASAPAAVVLGAAQYNGEPSAVLRARLDAAAELWADGRVDLVVVTGGGQEADVTTEAKSGYNYLRETHGLSDEELRLEVQGSSTYESLAAASRFLRSDGIDDVILVTDPYHARRSPDGGLRGWSGGVGLSDRAVTVRWSDPARRSGGGDWPHRVVPSGRQLPGTPAVGVGPLLPDDGRVIRSGVDENRWPTLTEAGSLSWCRLSGMV